MCHHFQSKNISTIFLRLDLLPYFASDFNFSSDLIRIYDFCINIIIYQCVEKWNKQLIIRTRSDNCIFRQILMLFVRVSAPLMIFWEILSDVTHRSLTCWEAQISERGVRINARCSKIMYSNVKIHRVGSVTDNQKGRFIFYAEILVHIFSALIMVAWF